MKKRAIKNGTFHLLINGHSCLSQIEDGLVKYLSSENYILNIKNNIMYIR